MAISPDFGLEQAQAIADSYAQAELTILARISGYLKQGADVPDWERIQLANVQNLRLLATNTLSDFSNNAAMDIDDAIGQAYDAGGASAFSDLFNDVEEVSAVGSLARQEAVRAISREVTGAVVNATGAVLRQVDDAFRSIVAESVSLVTAGGMTRRIATQQAINKFLNNGLTVATTGNRQMNIADYTQMAIRTGTARASVEGHLDAMAVNGINLVYINPGPRHCELCHYWTGKILHARSGSAGKITVTSATTGRPVTVEVAGSLDTARSAGWGHPNCRCSVSAYIPGATKVPKQQPFDQKGYQDQQQQRVNERNIREWKRKAELAQTPEAQAKANAKIQENQQKQRDLMASNPNLKRQPSREQLFPRPSGGPSTSPRTGAPNPTTPKAGVKVDPPTGVGPDQFMSIGNERDLQNAFKDIYEGHDYNGFTTQVNRVSQGPGMTKIQMSVHDANGNRAGEVWRTFVRRDGQYSVKHDLMDIKPEFRGKGFSTAFSKYSEDYYRANGFSRINIQAALDDGGYVWAKAGYRFDGVPADVLYRVQQRADLLGLPEGAVGSYTDIPVAERRVLSEKLSALRIRMIETDPTDPNYPQPWEIANLEASTLIKGKTLGEWILRGSEWDGYKEL